jgi:type II secretion system protein L
MSVEHIYNLDQRVGSVEDPLHSVAGTNTEMMSLWIPSERVGLHWVDIPSAPQRKWAELIPWVLEDRILQPIEEMHFVVAGRSNSQLQILAVSHQDMKEWRRIADNAGVTAIAMVPDFMALHWEPGIISVGWREGMLLVRQSQNTGFAAEPNVGWTILESLVQDSNQAPRLSLSLPDLNMVPKQLTQDANINSSVIDWHFSYFDPSLNLMTGAFKPAPKQTVLSFWWPVAAAACLLLALWVGYLQTANRALEFEVVDLQQNVLANYTRLFSGSKPSLQTLKATGESQVDQLFKQQQSLQGQPMAALLALDKIMAGCQCELEGFSANQDGLNLTLRGGAELAKKSLAMKGYQFSLNQDKAAGSDIFLLSVTGLKNQGSGR